MSLSLRAQLAYYCGIKIEKIDNLVTIYYEVVYYLLEVKQSC